MKTRQWAATCPTAYADRGKQDTVAQIHLIVTAGS